MPLLDYTQKWHPGREAVGRFFKKNYVKNFSSSCCLEWQQAIEWISWRLLATASMGQPRILLLIPHLALFPAPSTFCNVQDFPRTAQQMEGNVNNRIRGRGCEWLQQPLSSDGSGNVKVFAHFPSCHLATQHPTVGKWRPQHST